MAEAQEAVRFCPGCGASVAEIESPRFCASCGQRLHRQADEQGNDSEASTPPPPRQAVPKKSDDGIPQLRTWPGWLALLIGVSSTTGMRQNVENGDDVGPMAFAMADLIVLCAVVWLVVRYIKRWKFNREWKRSQA